MVYTYLSHELKAVLPNPNINGFKLTSIRSLCGVGNDLYVLKSCGKLEDNSYYPIALYKVKKYNEDQEALMKETQINLTCKDKSEPLCRYANSICYHSNISSNKGFLFVSTGNDISKPQLLKLTIKGEVKKELFYTKNGENQKIGAITSYGHCSNKMRFIIETKEEDDLYDSFDVCTLKRDSFYYIGNSFKIRKEKGFILNDIFYNKYNNKLYAFYTKKKSDGLYLNYISTFILSYLANKDILVPIDTYIDDVDEIRDLKYKIVSGTIIDSEMYVSSVCKSTRSIQGNKDSIFLLFKKFIKY